MKGKQGKQQGKIIAQGAEAILIKKGNLILKRRIKKGYRNEELDFMLRTTRTRHEARILEKVSNIIPAPKIKAVNGMARKARKPFNIETEIEMQYIKGKLLSEWLDRFPISKALDICKEIGQNIAKIHNNEIIHNDLTTSNMILKGRKVYFIDFGLSFHSARIEDKAVDLHLLKEALKAKHFKRWKKYFTTILKSYKIASNQAKAVMEKLKKVEARGRYKGKRERLKRKKQVKNIKKNKKREI